MTAAAEPQTRVDLALEPDFQLGRMHVSPSACRVRLDGREERVEPRVTKVLVVLAASADRTVTRDQLIAACWDGRIVSDDAITRTIAKVRALAREADPPPFTIETVPKLGFRLLAGQATPAAEKPAARPRSGPRTAIALAAGLVVAAVAGWLVLRELRPPAAAEPRVEVMLFRPVEPDPELERFSVVLADELVRVLAQNGVEVAARPLSADAAGGSGRFRVTGAVDRDGGRYVATAQIIDRVSGTVLWSERIDRAEAAPDGFHRQAAWRIGDVLHCGLDRLHRGGGEMSERLFSLFLNACSHWRSYGSDWAALLESSRRVAKAAPRLSHAHSMHAVGAAMVSANSPAGPAQSQALRAEALAAARRSLELDPGNGEAYLAIGASYPQGGGWRAREENFLRALQLDPQLRSGGNLYMHVLRETGRADQALEQVTRALATDPFSHGMIGARALLHAAAGDIPAAHADLEQLDLVQPGEADELRWQIAFWWEPPERGLEATARYAPQSDPALSCFNLYLDRLRQARGAPLRGLPESCATAPPDWRVRMLARQGDVDGAYRELEQPLPARRRHTIFLFYPEMKAFRQDPRFMPLAQRLGLVDYWRQSGRWPDFCSEQDLPYDCRAAAESLKAASNEDAAR